MGILDRLSDPAAWAEFREYKSTRGNTSNRDVKKLDEFISGAGYLPVTDRLGEEHFGFPLPLKRVINKSGSRKKRVIYTFPEAETYVLKLMTFLLYKYDGYMSGSCFSFRRGVTAKDAIDDILRRAEPSRSFVLKADVSDYFNSIPEEKLARALGDVVTDDPALLLFLTDFYTRGAATDGEKTVYENRGAMAGVPLSAFAANVYLASLDRAFEARGVPYYRYSDDILVFAKSEDELKECEKLLGDHLKEKGLSLNPDKVAVSAPGDPWEFLGFRYDGGKIDLSLPTLKKMKDKISRKCRALYRWRIRKNVGFERAARVVIRLFNRKYFDEEGFHDFTWSRWFFPVLTTDACLRELDRYLADHLRYIATGRFYKGNYRVTYGDLKALGYRSLVNEYHKFRRGTEQTAGSRSAGVDN